MHNALKTFFSECWMWSCCEIAFTKVKEIIVFVKVKEIIAFAKVKKIIAFVKVKEIIAFAKMKEIIAFAKVKVFCQAFFQKSLQVWTESTNKKYSFYPLSLSLKHYNSL